MESITFNTLTYEALRVAGNAWRCSSHANLARLSDVETAISHAIEEHGNELRAAGVDGVAFNPESSEPLPVEIVKDVYMAVSRAIDVKIREYTEKGDLSPVDKFRLIKNAIFKRFVDLGTFTAEDCEATYSVVNHDTGLYEKA
ncbi:MAG: hypothetical protein UT33_C0006G0043 [Candidatus Peregrinibacteria bacterium GW2011_GWC2_39_14]|nr:MAG: hypothetical protein UT33_C0006G0043 [Candidatus Peregrinibacteria bacterium GW2011_GWC2_39_14]